MRWQELAVTCSCRASEAVAAILHQATSGIVVEDSPHQVTYKAYVPEGPQLEQFSSDLAAKLASLPAILLEEGAPAVSRSWVEEEDWAESWKAYYVPMRVGRTLVIKPSWQAWPPAEDPAAARPDDLIIELDPGMAFGTGAHATTRLCLIALEDWVRPGVEVMDLGCGSGILSVAALKLGAAHVLAIDADPLAMEATRANCERNHVQGCEVCLHEGLEDLNGQWDVVVANISAAVIMAQTLPVAQRLSPGGLFICSGFYVGHDEEIADLLEEHGFELLRREEMEMWSCLTGRKR